MVSAAHHALLLLVFDLPSPVRRLDQPQGSGGLGEHCSSPAVGRGVCAPPGRVAQPRLLAADRGNPEGAANRGRLFFGYFILAKQKKVACCRATPGEVVLALKYEVISRNAKLIYFFAPIFNARNLPCSSSAASGSTSQPCKLSSTKSVSACIQSLRSLRQGM